MTIPYLTIDDLLFLKELRINICTCKKPHLWYEYHDRACPYIEQSKPYFEKGDNMLDTGRKEV